jgi:tetratricopeptide (TPR) repeat protein
MMTRPRLSIPVLLFVLMLGACASAGTGTPGEGPSQGAEGAAPPALDPALTEEWLYEFLVAELATQRGELAEASRHYLQAARLTRDARVAEQAARVAVFAGETRVGMEAARLWTDLDPGNLEARQVTAILVLRAGRPEEAVRELEVLALGDGGGPGQGFMAATSLLSREDDKDAALAVMRGLVARHDTDPEAHFALAHLAARADDPALALQEVDRTLALKPSWGQAVILRSRLLLGEGRTEDALAYLGKAVEADPDDLAVRLHHARLLLNQERYADALKAFEALAQAQPENGDVLLTLAVLHLQAEQADAARAVLERLLTLDKRPLEAHFYLGQIAEAEGDPEQAIAHYGQVDGGRHYLDAQVRVAVLLAEDGRLDQAMAHLDSLRARGGDQVERLYLVRGELLRDAERYQQAMEVYSRGLDELPSSTDLLYARAMAAERLDRIDLLEEDLRAILAADPDNVQALNALGYTLADRTSRYREALGYVTRALELQPDDYYILDSMGWVQFRLGNLEMAEEYLRKALATRVDPEIAAHLGEVLWVQGREDEARAIWRQGLDMDPEARTLVDTLERLQVHQVNRQGVP